MFANHRTHQRVNVGEAYALVESRSGDFIGEGDAGLARIGEGAAAAAAAAAVPTSPIVKSPHQHRNLGAGIVDARPVPPFAFNRSLASPQTRTSSLLNAPFTPFADSPPRCAAQSPAAPMYSRIAAHASSRGS